MTSDRNRALREQLRQIIEETGGERDNLISWLQQVQANFNYVPEESLNIIAELSGIPLAEITGVVTFYGQFRLRPAGQHFIRVCIGTACHVKGAERIYDAFRRELGITGKDDTDPKRLFTVEKVACLGCCMLAPAVQIDETIYGPVSTRDIPKVLENVLASRNPGRGRARKATRHAKGRVRLCTCSSCNAAGADAVLQALQEAAEQCRIRLDLKEAACTGVSYEAPLVTVRGDDGTLFRYGGVKPGDCAHIIQHHFGSERPLARRWQSAKQVLGQLIAPETDDPITRYPADIRARPDAAYWTRQTRIVTEGAGTLPPLDLQAYRNAGGLAALDHAVNGMEPEAITRIIVRSGLRGRGGAGYPTGKKWAAVAAVGGEAVIICNGDEGDPGAFMDRMLLESFPFRVIEGITIAAKAIGATSGIFYVRHEYPLALARIRTAIAELEAHGWLGDRIQGSNFSFTLRVTEGAGAFVCGEETALLASLEGKRGTPRSRPPYPSEEGFHGRPTLVNNVETLATIPWILHHGADAFRSHGTEKSPGTKTFALAGRVKRGGLVEVPMGTTLKQVVNEIGGGIPNGQALKAIQVGGPSGGCVPADLADTAVDYEALNQMGAIMGSGGMVVLDESDCIVDISRYFLAFTQQESCGKCVPCRSGTHVMLVILDRLCAGKATAADIATLERTAKEVQSLSMCGLGRTAPNPILSALMHFRDEFEAHLHGQCPAGKCKALIRYEVGDRCIGCTRCIQVCPVDAIPFTPHEQHSIDDALCTRCDHCRQACPVDAIAIVDAATPE